MILNYRVFVAVIYCICLFLSGVFYIVAMHTDDSEGLGVWGAAASFLATFVSGLTLAILTIYLK